MTRLQVTGAALAVLIAASLTGCNKPAAPPTEDATPATADASAAAPPPAAAAEAAPPAKPAADASGDQGNPHPQ